MTMQNQGRAPLTACRTLLAVMHLRVICPPERTDAVVSLLRECPGATNLVLMAGSVLAPPGDLVLADVAREGVDAVVWRELVERTEEDSTLSVTFLVFLVVATLIAAVGLLIDSQVLIVGAMVLGPEFSPLAGLAVALVDRDRHQARLSARALLIGFPVAVALTALAVVLLHAAGQVPHAYLAGRRPLTSFVSSPDVFSVIVALLAGVAGTFSLTASKASTLVGVFISVTTVPAAAEIAAASVTGQGSVALGSLVQLLVNLACIVVAAVVTLELQRLGWRRVVRAGPARGGGARGVATGRADAAQPRGSSGP